MAHGGWIAGRETTSAEELFLCFWTRTLRALCWVPERPVSEANKGPSAAKPLQPQRSQSASLI